MKPHSESLIAYVIEFTGLGRDKAIEWLDMNLPRFKGDEDEK